MKYRVNDNELIYMVRENDERYLEELFKKYEPIVISICNMYYDSVISSGVEFDDLKQECYISLYKAYLNYNTYKNNSFYTFACTCMKNHMRTYFRDINVNKNRILNNSIFIDDFSSLNIGYTFDYDNYSEEIIRIKNLFDIRLSSVFELRYNGFSYDEISKLLGISKSTVDSRLCQIRYTLKNMSL